MILASSHTGANTVYGRCFGVTRKLSALLASFAVLLCCLSLCLPEEGLAYQKIEFLHEFGSHGKDAGQFKEPRALALDQYGDVYVADTKNHRIQVFSPEGVFRVQWGSEGSNAGQFESPSGIAVGNGKVFVADTDNHRIQIFDTKGRHAGSFGRKGDGPKEFRKPSGIAFWKGLLYVSDTGNDRIQVFTEDGIFLSQIMPGKNKYWSLEKPQAVAVDSGGNIYILDKENKIVIFTQGGHLLRTAKQEGDAMCISADGIYVAHEYRLKKYDFAMRERMRYGTEGSDAGMFREISDMKVSVFRTLYVLDAEKNSVQIFRAEASSDGQVDASFPSSVTYHRDIPLKVRTILRRMDTTLFAYDDASEKVVQWTEGVHEGGKAERGEAIWVANRDRHRLDKYDTRGNLLLSVGSRGAGDSQFDLPSGIAQKKDLLYVADSGNARIQVFNEQGAFVAAFGRKGIGKGELRRPASLTFDTKENLYIIDQELHKVLKTDSSGNVILEFGSEGSGDGEFRGPSGIQIADNEVYVLDSGNSRIQVFDAYGNFLRKFGSAGDGKGEFDRPSSLYIDESYSLYVVDGDGGRVQQLKLHLTPAKPQVVRADGMIRETKISWTANREEHVSLYKVLRRKAGQSEFEEIGRIPASGSFSTLAFFDRNLPSNTTFSYAVVALSRTGNESVMSDVLTATTKKLIPSAPELINAKSGQEDLFISWKPSPEPYTDHYLVSRIDDAWRFFKEIRKTNDPAFHDVGLMPNTLYKYRIVAVGAEGDRSAPLEVEVKTQRLPTIAVREVTLEDVFAGNYKYYEMKPFGTIILQNNSENSVSDVKITFMIKDYMDYPSEVLIEKIRGGSREEAAIRAVFNSRLLDLTENSPLQAEIRITYPDDTGEQTLLHTKSLTVFEKHALIWDRVGMASLYVTPKDPALLSLATNAVLAQGQGPLNKSLLQAHAVFESLNRMGITYLQDPNNPYQKVSRDVSLIDYIQYPRETLARKAGDCDDLVVLYASLLEGLGISTAFIAYPGHILMMFDTSLPDGAGAEFGFPREKYVVHEGRIWVPVELTLLGSTFHAAWQKGMDQVHEWQGNEMTIVPVREAWEDFKPASLPYSELRPEPVQSEGKEPVAGDEVEDLKRQRVNYIRSLIEDEMQTGNNPMDALARLGILYGENGMYKEAMDVMKTLITRYGESATVLNNMGNIYLLQGDYTSAENAYLKALMHDMSDTGIMINFARCYFRQGKMAKARKYFEMAIKADPEIGKKYFYLASELRR